MDDAAIHGGDIYRNRVQHDFSVNINPLGMPERVRDAVREAADSCGSYPDINADALRCEIGEFYGVSSDQILCGNGSSELLMAVVHALKPKKTVIPVPSFYGYERAAGASDGEIVYFPPDFLGEREPDGSIGRGLTFGGAQDLQRLSEILTRDVSLLFLANPNNPTSTCIRPDVLEELLDHCRENGITVVLDECFLEFVEDGRERSCLGKTERWPNLIVLRAFTKIFAVPGVRLGWMACSDPGMIMLIKRHLPEWNVSVPAQQAGRTAMEVLRKTSFLDETVRIVKKERNYLSSALSRLGFRVYPSEADFLMFFSEVPLYEPLLARGFLIRDCANFRGLREGYYRIAVKTREENERLLAAMEEILGRGE